LINIIIFRSQCATQRGEKVIPAQCKIALSISLLESSIKEQIVEQQEELCKELYFDNRPKCWDQNKTFEKITLLNLNIIMQVKQMVCTH